MPLVYLVTAFLVLATTVAVAPSELVLQLRLLSTPVTPLEPVVVEYVLRNPTDREVSASATMMVDSGRLKIWITGPDDNRKQYGFGSRAHVLTSGSTHPPGSAWTSDAVLSWNSGAKEFAFFEPGEYTIEAEMTVQGGMRGRWPARVATASAVTVTVRAMTPEEEAAVDALGGEEAVGKLLRFGVRYYCEMDSSVACFESVRTFVHNYAESPLAPAVSWKLSETVGHGHITDVQSESALQLRREFLERWPSHPLARRVTESQIYQLLDLDGAAAGGDEAAALLDEYERKWPGYEKRIGRLRRKMAQATDE